jgi:hypothetical protein
MAWFWYLQGFEACLFGLSVLLNIGFATGFVKYNRRKTPLRSVNLYDQDNSNPLKRVG